MNNTTDTNQASEYVLLPYEVEVTVCADGKKPYTKKRIQYWYTPVDELEEQS